MGTTSRQRQLKTERFRKATEREYIIYRSCCDSHLRPLSCDGREGELRFSVFRHYVRRGRPSLICYDGATYTVWKKGNCDA